MSGLIALAGVVVYMLIAVGLAELIDRADPRAQIGAGAFVLVTMFWPIGFALIGVGVLVGCLYAAVRNLYQVGAGGGLGRG